MTPPTSDSDPPKQRPASAKLQLVDAIPQIRENTRRFVRDLLIDRERTRKLIRQTTYWVFDEDEAHFGPSKFVGYREMTFPRYELAVGGNSEGATFDGGITRRAIESVIGRFHPDDQLTNQLIEWCKSTMGANSLDGIDLGKWEFASLSPERGYWAFLCVPEIYDGLAAAKVLDEIVWNVDRGEPKVGDRVIVWQAKGAGKHRGVVAIGEISEGVATMSSPPQERPFWRSEEFGPKRSIRFRVIRAPRIPIWEDQKNEWLRDLAVARARGGTVFSLEPSQWHRIVKAANAEDNVVVDATTSRLRGQGFISDPRVRKAVELYAQGLAEAYFAERGYEVRDVHLRESHDLYCVKPGSEVFVEAKGTISDGEAVFLTRNEVEFARTHKSQMALAIVRRIQVLEEGGKLVARGGELTVTFPWDIDQGVLSPIQYEYSLPTA